MTPDQGRRFMFEGHPVRGQLACLEKTLQDIFGLHKYPPRVAEQLGQCLVAASLLGDTLKLDGSLVIQIKGNGPLGTLMVERDSEGRLRGIAKYTDDDPALTQGVDLTSLYGTAHMAISLLPKKGERYQGIVPMEGESLAAIIDGYFAQSEQLPTRLWLTADGQRAAGMLLQQLPANPGEDVMPGHWEHLTTLAETLTADELKQLDHETLLHRLYHEESIRLFEGKDVSFYCPCSRQRSARALLSLGIEDLKALMNERESVTVDCEFCAQSYVYDQTDLGWLTSENNAPGSDQLQ